ncbi:MAG: hypothetical protein KAH03_04655 [Cocleimonas sp.]|nr:hypothetical protein [Cocleimonas sp.]
MANNKISIKSLIIITLLILPITAYADIEKEAISGVQRLKDTVDKAWDENITTLTNVVGEKWASLMMSTAVDSEVLEKALKETWSKALEGSMLGEELSHASSTISRFITDEVNDTKQTASDSKTLINEGKLVDGLWYLSSNLIKNTDDNLGKVVQESELMNTVGKITATAYGGPQGAAAYASWYAYKETNDPEMALKVGIMSGTNNAAFSGIDEDSITQLLKNNIITGVMAGLSVAISGGNEDTIKNTFLKTTATGLVQGLPIINPTSLEKNNQEDKALSQAPIVKF